MKMMVFIGKLDRDVSLVREVHELLWVDIDENFFDTSRYAGEGNIGHMIEIYKQHRKIIFKD
jgi:8-oxo-dGTP diphosphatase